MKIIRVLDSSGDRAITFDDSEACVLARADARECFERMLARGATAFKVNRGEGRIDEKVTEFAAIENETILVPRIVGG
jgi:L-alanine-DL-glutamate epimerase-like enolase superfamily enzyme